MDEKYYIAIQEFSDACFEISTSELCKYLNEKPKDYVDHLGHLVADVNVNLRIHEISVLLLGGAK